MSILLQGGLVHSAEGFIEADIRIQEDMITTIAQNLSPASDEKVIDCTGKHVCPGFIDVHVHFREPGFPHKEDFLSGSRAAAAGGVTTIFDMPNTKPPTVTQKDLDDKRGFAKKSLVNYGLYVLGCKENMKSVGSFSNIPGIKVYLGSSTGNYLTDDLGVFVEIVKHAKDTVVVHAENEQLIQYFCEQFKETQLHHKMRDNLCAVTSVAESTTIAGYLGKKLHIAHMSTKEEVDFLRKNKTEKISCEVCPHHLFLDEQFFLSKKNYGKMNPPLRYKKDQEALWQGIKEGIIDMISTDHAPHTPEEKDNDFFHAPCGVPGVQTMVPLMLNAVSEHKLSLLDMVRLCATNPAKLFGIPNRGELREGYHADISIVDMEKEAEIQDKDQLSKCGWTPFNGKKIKGWPIITIVNGHIVNNNGVIDDSPHGQEVFK